jgi:hypothetical protein
MALTPEQLAQLNAQMAKGQSANPGGLNFGDPNTSYTTLGLATGGGEGGDRAAYDPQTMISYDPNKLKFGDKYSQLDSQGNVYGEGAWKNGNDAGAAGMIALAIITGGVAMELGLFAGMGAEAVDPALMVQGNSINALDAATGVGYGSEAAGGVSGVAGETVGTAGAASSATPGVFSAAADSQAANAALGLGADSSVVPSVTVNAATGTPGALTSSVQSAVSQGASLTDAIKSVASSSKIPVSTIMSALSSAGNAAGNALLSNGGLGALLNAGAGALQAGAATSAGDQIAAGAHGAADILSPAYIAAGNTLASGYTDRGNLTSQGLLQGGNTIAGGYRDASQTMAAGALQGGQTLASGFTTAAGQQVAGLDNAQGAADRTLAAQKAIQQPYQAGRGCGSTHALRRACRGWPVQHRFQHGRHGERHAGVHLRAGPGGRSAAQPDGRRWAGFGRECGHRRRKARRGACQPVRGSGVQPVAGAEQPVSRRAAKHGEHRAGVDGPTSGSARGERLHDGADPDRDRRRARRRHSGRGEGHQHRAAGSSELLGAGHARRFPSDRRRADQVRRCSGRCRTRCRRCSFAGNDGLCWCTGQRRAAGSECTCRRDGGLCQRDQHRDWNDGEFADRQCRPAGRSRLHQPDVHDGTEPDLCATDSDQLRPDGAGQLRERARPGPELRRQDGATYSMSDAWPVPDDYGIFF